ncbi:MAG: endo-1,4-beta-xylanase [Acidobacteriaceae bacterium]
MWTRRQFLSAGSGAALTSILTLGGCGHRGPKRSARTMAPGLGGRGMDVSGSLSLKAHAEKNGLLYGSAVRPELFKTDAAYTQLVIDQCDILVAEDAMKWAALRPTFNSYSFDEADALLAFAEQHQMKLRGHNLVWHEALPKWFASMVNKSNARQVLIDHIQTVAGRYSGRMHSWDVVNEAVWVQDGRADGLRKSPWLEMVGDDYIELAFRTARQADPNALLTYNDYGIEEDSYENEEKRAAVLLLLRRMKARNVPMDAVGIQSHLTANPAAPFKGDGLKRFIASVRELQLQVFVTEMDVAGQALPADIGSRDDAVAALYRDYMNVVLANPAVTAVLTWGITDRYTWLQTGKPRKDGMHVRPLPFDEEYRAKAAFVALRRSFDERALPASDTQGATNPASDPYAPFTPNPAATRN